MKKISSADLKHIANWVLQLVELCRPGAEPITKQRVATYASFLAEDYPREAFTLDSLKTIARGHDFFPSLSVLGDHLQMWWDQHRPRSSSEYQVTGPLGATLDDRHKAVVAMWMKRRAENAIPNLRTSLAVLRQQWLPSFDYVVANDSEAADIAERRGWISADDARATRRASWNDPAKIRASAALVRSNPLHQMRLGKLLARCVAVNAPQHMHHVPPEWHLTEDERLEAHA